MNRRIDSIIIHCSATPEGVDYSALNIDSWHKARGFKKIGYHYVIRLDGTIEAGRKLNEIGAHCTGHNAHSIGICYIGGLDSNNRPKDTRTQAQKDILYSLLRGLKQYYPNAKIYGHNEFANKECPCFDVAACYGKL